MGTGVQGIRGRPTPSGPAGGRCGVHPTGTADEIRALAGRVSVIGEELEHDARRVLAIADVDWRGEAAEAFRRRVAVRSSGVAASAHGVERLADALFVLAGEREWLTACG